MSVGAIDTGVRRGRAMRRRRGLPLALAALLLATVLQAGEVGGYLPLNLAPRLEADVEQMLALADRPVIRRPIPLSDITDALTDACQVDEPLCLRVQRELAPWLGRAALGMASFEAAIATAAHGADSSRLTEPNARGEPLEAHWQLAAQGYVQISDHVRLNAGGVAYQGRRQASGSFVSVGVPRAQLDIGYRDHWWSPMHDSAMLLSTEAPTLLSATLANTVPLTRARIRYEVFGSRLSRSEQIEFGNGLTAGNPLYGGISVSIEPARGWSISGSRVLQYGGGQRPGSARDLPKYLLRGTGNSGVGTPGELGNEEVSVGTQLTVPGPMPMVVSMEYAAEDTFHSQSTRFGSGALSAGIYLPRIRPDLGLRYEFSNWEDVWYTHHIYLDGLRNDGLVTGNWGADWRRLADTAGGQSHMLQLDWARSAEARYSLLYRTEQTASYTGQHYHRAHQLRLQVLAPWRRFDFAVSLTGGVDPYGHGFGRLAATLYVAGDARYNTASAPEVEAAPRRAGGVERFVDAGITTGRLRYEQDFNVVPGRITSVSAAHVGLGVRRAVGRHSDLGARVEADRIGSATMLGLRALDYRYRAGAHVAATAFFGFGRYDVRSPAHGWYAGAGVQWRDALPGWDVALEERYFDRIVRRKTLPGETTIVWPNEFWSLLGTTLSVSRRF